MVRLSELVESLGGSCRSSGQGGPDAPILDVHQDSRRIEPGHLFAALPGLQVDGVRFASQALERGAVAILSPRDLPEEPVLRGPWSSWVHPEARRVMGEAAALVHERPSHSQGVVGITGTNGKSTVAHFTEQLARAAGLRPGLAGTIEVRLHGQEPRAATHTTPDATELQRLCRRNKELGGDTFVLEVSSHALDQERIAGLELNVAVFTNLSRDHLDYHPSMEAYAEAKARIFTHLDSEGWAVIHADDPAAERMMRAARASGARVVTYGIGSRVDLSANSMEFGPTGTNLFLEGMGIPRTGLFLPQVGRHNIENALAAIAAVLKLGAGPSRVLQGLASISLPRGRLEQVDVGARGFRVFVDYAHTPAALERVLGTLREVLGREVSDSSLGKRLLCVFGCGGDRDAEKRSFMGEIVGRLADVAIVTSDNPRDEDPHRICDEILSGMGAASAQKIVEIDRRTAIRRALHQAGDGDVVLIAGKGHETWQQLRGVRLSFDDVQVAREELP